MLANYTIFGLLGLLVTLSGIIYAIVAAIKRRRLAALPYIAGLPAMLGSLAAYVHAWDFIAIVREPPEALSHPENLVFLIRDMVLLGCIETCLLLGCCLLVHWRAKGARGHN